MLEFFRCPDQDLVHVKDCLDICRMGERCMTLPTLTLIAEEREFDGVPSTTQLINGTMYEFLKLTQPYITDPDSRAFMLSGTKHHKALEMVAVDLGLPAEIALNIDRDIFDLLEEEDGELVMTDYKNWGSFKVAKAIGMVKTGMAPDPSGAVYKKSGWWGKAGTPKQVPVFAVDPSQADNWEAELQQNRYRVMLKEKGIEIKRMQIQATVRDGSTAVARDRGIIRNIYRIPVAELDDDFIVEYFQSKTDDLLTALRENEWKIPCDDKESWEGRKCTGYCDVAPYCIRGMISWAT